MLFWKNNILDATEKSYLIVLEFRLKYAIFNFKAILKTL